MIRRLARTDLRVMDSNRARKAPESNPAVKLTRGVNQRAREFERVALGGPRATVGVALGPRDSRFETESAERRHASAQSAAGTRVWAILTRGPAESPGRKPDDRREFAAVVKAPREEPSSERWARPERPWRGPEAGVTAYVRKDAQGLRSTSSTSRRIEFC